MIKAVVFDFDGLIIDTETTWFDSYYEVLSSYNIEFPLDVFSRCIGTHGSELQLHLEALTGNAETTRVIETSVLELHKTKMLSVEAREGVRDYLEAARRLGLRIGLASSSNRLWIDNFLAVLGLNEYFEVIKSSDDVAHVKPDPELYVQAVEALGIEPFEALAFEDSVNGSKAAKAAGLYCVIVPNPVTEKLAFENYDMRIQSMGDLPLEALIQQLNVDGPKNYEQETTA
ncbi:HAD family hydrolase [Paenibacillus eucommiae]|uniref:Hydrolase of the HAD superfamily n=1 Tax=Paenibacillus eucommiae TaxID=1355755 RepID=A0ABS4J2L2_9BACL|nr:HAD family hydrolase [Paenibacillus eucommiae]MBP1994070.1 putative hydrolase of the HAD superfamily [Paenibacillus eucommiae]